MADEFTNVEFLKVDVDDAEEIAAECGVQAMPTFQVFKGGAKVEEMSGAHQEGLKTLISKYN